MSKKRGKEDASSEGPKPKRIRTESKAKSPQKAVATASSKSTGPPSPATSKARTEEIDFPRGGGTNLSAIEYKALQEEARKELDDELFEDELPKDTRRNSKSKGKAAAVPRDAFGEQAEVVARTHTLSYRNVTVGTKVLCRIVSVKPLALVVALPDHLVGHIPLTNISSIYSQRLDDVTKDISDIEEEDEDEDSFPPELAAMYRVGEYVRAIVVRTAAAGVHAELGSAAVTDEERRCGRLEMSMTPEKLNEGLVKGDLQSGLTLSATVKSVEDHGYIMDLGLTIASGFLSFNDAAKRDAASEEKLPVGLVVQSAIKSMSSNGRICNLLVDQRSLATSAVGEASSIGSVLPGALVSGLITDSSDAGLHVQILGLFQATIHSLHIPLDSQKRSKLKIGKRVQGRVMYDVHQTSPPTFGLSLLPHLLQLQAPTMETTDTDDHTSQSILESFPRGTRLDSVKVIGVHKGWGLACKLSEGVVGFVPIRSITEGDDIPTLHESTGPWKLGSTHAARVLGFAALDGLPILTVKSGVIEEQYLTVDDVAVGQVVKVTVKSLTDTHMLVSLSNSLTGIVTPLHYSDVLLKHPERKFQIGKVVKARVLHVDSVQNKVKLTMKRSLMDPELSILERFEDAKVDMVVTGTIFKILPNAVLVEYFGDTKGFIGTAELSEEPVQSIASSFKLGQVVKTRITYLDLMRRRIFASIRKTLSSYAPSTVAVGESVHGPITAVIAKRKRVRVKLDPSGVDAYVSFAQLTKKMKVKGSELQGQLEAGKVLDGLFVQDKDDVEGIILCSFHPPKSVKEDEDIPMVTKGFGGEDGPSSIADYKIGDVVEAKVVGRSAMQTRLTVQGCRAYLSATDTCDDYTSESAEHLPDVGTTVQAVVIGVDAKALYLSTRRSRLDVDSRAGIVDPEISSESDLEVGQAVRGFVIVANEARRRILLGGRNIMAMVSSREPVELKIGQVVKGTIKAIDGKKIKMTLLTPEELSKWKATRSTAKDLTVGQEVVTHVDKIEPVGIFLRIEGTRVVGLCHKNQITNNADADVEQALEGLQPGDTVRAVIIKIDGRRVDLSLRPSQFPDRSDPSVSKRNAVLDEEDSDDSADVRTDDEPMNDSDSDSDASDTVAPAMSNLSVNETLGSTKAGSAPSLKLQGGFNWSGEPVDEDVEMTSGSEASDDDLKASSPSKKKKTKKGIQRDLTSDMHNKSPESSAEFERLLKVTPDSSFLWIQFMAFQLQLSEVEKAREIGRRAIQVINYREEQEKLNVWLALLNLEIAYGSYETAQSVFAEATRANDAKTVHLRFASLLEEAGKQEQAEEAYQRALKKFGTSSKVWTLFGEFYLRAGRTDDARLLLPRSLKSLERRKHVKTISQFAQLEYKHGDPERGKTIFEGIVTSHAKRLDLWAIYVDQEAKLGNVDSIRIIFKRLLQHKLSSKKAKFVFKKWLELERTIGTEEGAEDVKTRAIAWTQQNATSAS